MRSEFGDSAVRRTGYFASIYTNSNQSWNASRHYFPGLRTAGMDVRKLIPKNSYAGLRVSFRDSEKRSVLEASFPYHMENSSYNGNKKIKIFRPVSLSQLEMNVPLPVRGRTRHSKVFNLYYFYGSDIYIYSLLRFFVFAEISPDLVRNIKDISVEYQR